MFLFKHKKSKIGLEITDSNVKALELQKKATRLEIVSLGSKALPDNIVKEGVVVEPQKLGKILLELWKENKFAKREVFIGVANQDILVRFATFPKVENEKLKNIIKFQAREYLPIANDDIILDYSITREKIEQNKPQLEVLIVAAKKSMLDNFIVALQVARLTPVDIEVLPLSLLRILKTEKRSVFAVINVEDGMSYLVIVEERVPKLVRMIPHEKFAWNEGLIGELANSISFYQSQEKKEVEKIIVSGKGSYSSELHEKIKKGLNIPVAILRPIEELNLITPNTIDVNTVNNDYTLCISLAMRDLEKDN